MLKADSSHLKEKLYFIMYVDDIITLIAPHVTGAERSRTNILSDMYSKCAGVIVWDPLSVLPLPNFICVTLIKGCLKIIFHQDPSYTSVRQTTYLLHWITLGPCKLKNNLSEELGWVSHMSFAACFPLLRYAEVLKIYHGKRTDAADFLNFKSKYPETYKVGVIKCLIYRSYHVSSN